MKQLLFYFLLSSITFSQEAKLVFDGYINGDFEGWEGETIFEMSDGSYWIQDEYLYFYQYSYSPEAIIYQRNNKYFLKVEDVDETLRVKPLEKVIKSKIDGDFEGFEGETIYKLLNGTIWQQIDGRYKYKYSYAPEVIIYRADNAWKMKVKGITVKVIQLK